MRRRAPLARNSARSGRSAPDARSLRAKRARGSFQKPSGKPAPNPKSIKFSNPISVHFSKPIDTGSRSNRCVYSISCVGKENAAFPGPPWVGGIHPAINLAIRAAESSPAGELRIPPGSGRVPPGGGDEWQARSRLGFLTRLAHLAPRSGADPARGSAQGRHSVLDVARLGLFRPTATNKGTSNPAWRVPMAPDALTVRWPRKRPPRKAQGSHGDRRRSPDSPCQQVATRSSDVRH